MPVRVGDLQGQQNLSVDISGPDGANKLLILTGTAGINLVVGGSGEHTGTYSFNVGPSLTRDQFRQAIATASLARIGLSNPGAGTDNAHWSLNAVDADWDDEANQVEVRLEVAIMNPGQASRAYVLRVAYQVTVLAQL